MKQFLQHRSNRAGYDGWALRVAGEERPIAWTTCTTREEARELKQEMESEDPDFFRRLIVVKVSISVGVVK